MRKNDYIVDNTFFLNNDWRIQIIKDEQPSTGLLKMRKELKDHPLHLGPCMIDKEGLLRIGFKPNLRHDIAQGFAGQVAGIN